MSHQNPTAKMSKWTEPTNVPFFVMHKSAMGTYSLFSLVAHAVWYVFSIKPFTNLVASQVQDLGLSHTTVQVACALFLIVVHIALFALIKYAAYNKLDNDPNTVNSLMHYAAIVIICTSMFFLDVQGATATLRNADKFEAKRENVGGTIDRQKAERIEAYREQIQTLEEAAQAQNQSVIVEYNTKAAKIASRKVYDDYDRKRRASDLKALDSEKATQLANIETNLAAEKKAALKERNDAIAAFDDSHRTASRRIDTEDAANEKNAHTYGWIISLVCLVLVVGCKIQEISLRVKAGQKLISRISVADATGGFWAKLGFATSDIFERIGHKIVYLYHSFGTKWTRELDELDGSFSVSGYNYSTPSVPTPAPSVSSTPPPPPPPPSGNGNDNPPPPPPSGPVRPTPAPTNGVEMPIKKPVAFTALRAGEKQGEVKDAAYTALDQPTTEKGKLVKFRELPQQMKINAIQHFATSTTADPNKVARVLFELNPIFELKNDGIGYTAFMFHIIGKSIQNNTALRTFAQLSVDEQLDAVNSFVAEHGFSKKEARQIIEAWEGDIYYVSAFEPYLSNQMYDLIQFAKDCTPTPSVPTVEEEPELPIEIDLTPLTPAAHHQNGVAHQTESVPHLSTEKSDEMLEVLRLRMQKYSRSHFEGSKANNETVFNHIKKSCDEAVRLLLDKKNRFSDKAIEQFATTAENRLTLCKQYGFEYDSEETLFTLIEKSKEVSNG